MSKGLAMLRLGIFIAALIGVFLAALSLMPRYLSPGVYRAQALAGLNLALGQPVEAGGEVVIRFLPRPRLQLVDVRVRGDGPDTDVILMSADTATFDLHGRALITGQIQVEAVELERPVFHLTRDQDQSLTFGAAPLLAGLTGQSPKASRLTRLSLQGGEIRYRDEPFAQDFRVDIEELLVQRVSGYAFDVQGRIRSNDLPYDVAVSFVPTANPGGERGFDIEIAGPEQSVYHLRGSIDDKFGENFVIREDLDWKLTAENVQHPLFERLALVEGAGVGITLDARLMSDREGYDFQGLTLTRPGGQQMRGQARFIAGGAEPRLDVRLNGRGLSLSDAAADLPLRDWTALLPGAVKDLGGLTLGFDVKVQDLTLPNGESLERLTSRGNLSQAGLDVTDLSAMTTKGLLINLDSLESDGPDDLSFSGRLSAQDARPFAKDEARAAFIGTFGRIEFEGSVALTEGALVIEHGVFTTAQGAFTVDGAPFSLNAAGGGLGEQGVALVTDNLDLNAWVGDAGPGNASTLVDQGKAIASRMKTLGTNTLSMSAETANFGGRILRGLSAAFRVEPDGKTRIEATFAEDDGTQIQTAGQLSADGDALEAGNVIVVFNDEPRAAEKMIERFAPVAADNPLVAIVLDRLDIDGLSLYRTDPANPWELTLNSGETQITGSEADAEGNRSWLFRSTTASDLFQALDIPLSPDPSQGGVDISGRQAPGELVGIGSVLGADLTLQELAPTAENRDSGDNGAEGGNRAFKLNLGHADAQTFLAALGLDLALPSNGPIDIELNLSRLDQNYGYQIEALLGDGVRVEGNGFYSFQTRRLGFEGRIDQLDALPWLQALFVDEAEDTVLSPLLAALSGSLNLSIGRLDAGPLGVLTEAQLSLDFEPGRYAVSALTGTVSGGAFDGGRVQLSGDLLAGDDLFADLALEVRNMATAVEVVTDTALRFKDLGFATDSLQARATSIGSLLSAANASFEVAGEATLELALTSLNASESLPEGVWRDFLGEDEGITAYEDLRTLFFDGGAVLKGDLVLEAGGLRTNTLRLTGRKGTLLAKGIVDLDNLAARGLSAQEPLRIELYRSEDGELVEQVLLLEGPLQAPERLSIER